MSFGSRNKLAVALLSGGIFAVAPHFAIAQQTPTAQTQQAPALSAEQIADYVKMPAKMLADFKDSPEGLANAITQMAMSGTAGADAATAVLQAAAMTGNKSLAEAAAKGLGVAVANLTKSGNLALAQSIQASVALSASMVGNKEMADAMNGSFSSGQGGVATAATTATGAGGETAGGNGTGGGTGSAGTGSGGNGSSGGVSGAGNSFASSGGGGANTDSSTSNSASGSSFSGTGSSSVSASPT